MKRQTYEVPEAEVLAVLQEMRFLDSVDGYGEKDQAGRSFGKHVYEEDF